MERIYLTPKKKEVLNDIANGEYETVNYFFKDKYGIEETEK